MHIKDGWVVGIKQTPSPNFNQRPANVPIDMLVIHSISLPAGDYTTNDVEDFFQNKLSFDKHPTYEDIRDVKVSAHLFIRRNGHMQQFVSFNDRAWHAGVSEWQNRRGCNDFAIGIELEGHGDNAFETCQYQQLAAVVKTLMDVHPAITLDRIIGHCDIAPGRKTDPGKGFDWVHFRELVTSLQSTQRVGH